MSNQEKHLGARAIVAISGWLSANSATMKRSFRADRCAKLKTELGIECTEAQLARIEKELGFEHWERPKFARQEPGVKVDRVALLALAVHRLYEEVGSEAPEYVTAIRRKASAEEVEAAMARDAERSK